MFFRRGQSGPVYCCRFAQIRRALSRIPSTGPRSRIRGPDSYPDCIVIAAEGQTICEHYRVFVRGHVCFGETVYDWRHHLAVIQCKPGALRNRAPFSELLASFLSPGGKGEFVQLPPFQNEGHDVLYYTDIYRKPLDAVLEKLGFDFRYIVNSPAATNYALINDNDALPFVSKDFMAPRRLRPADNAKDCKCLR